MNVQFPISSFFDLCHLPPLATLSGDLGRVNEIPNSRFEHDRQQNGTDPLTTTEKIGFFAFTLF